MGVIPLPSVWGQSQTDSSTWRHMRNNASERRTWLSGTYNILPPEVDEWSPAYGHCAVRHFSDEYRYRAAPALLHDQRGNT